MGFPRFSEQKAFSPQGPLKPRSPCLLEGFYEFLRRQSSLGAKEEGITYLTPWLMAPGSPMPHTQMLSNNSYPEPNQPNPRIDTYFFKIHSNIVLPSSPWPS